MEATAKKATFQKYPAYKDSGVEWMGQIPAHWDMIPNKFIFKLKKNLVGKKSNQYTLLSLTLHGIIKRDMENPQGKFPAEFDTYQEVNNGDFVFCLFDVEETPRCVGLSDFDGMITGAYTVMQVGSKFDKRFLYYFYLNLDKDKRLRPLYTGLRNTISKDNFFAFKAFVPPLPEQTAIAAFLDDKTAKIDRAIAQKEKMIALLKERKQIIIQNAVTKGLDPNAKMKHSGVEWIGEIPEGWEVKRLKFLGNIYSGISGKSGEDFSKENNGSMKPFVPFTNICNNLKIDVDQYQYVRISESENQNRVKRCDLLFLMSSETLEDIAKNSIYLGDDQELYLNSFCKGFRLHSDRALPEYVNYLLYSKPYRDYFSLVGRGFTRINLKQEYINDVYTILPPIEEQTAIVSFIEAQYTKVDKAIKLQEQQIEKLKELKSTLIDSAVTGKIKVS